MKSILTRLSDALLIGSILALGALAYPVHADAGEARFIFRLKAATVEPVVVADNGSGDTGEESGGDPGATPGGDSGDDTGVPSEGDGDGTGTPPEAAATWPHMVITMSNGMKLICRSDDGYKAVYGKTPEIIATLLPGRVLTMTRATTASGTMPEYLKTGTPGSIQVEWAFHAGAVSAPRSGCNYGAILPGESTYSAKWTASQILTDAPLPAIGQTLTITDAHIERIVPYE